MSYAKFYCSCSRISTAETNLLTEVKQTPETTFPISLVNLFE